MATFTKFEQFTKDLVDGAHDFDDDTFKVALTNTAPTASTDAVFGDLTEISAGNGYTAGGATTTVTTSTTSGTAKITCSDVVFTASGAVGPFRYVVLYNDTTVTPAKPLIAFSDYGSSISLADGETFTVNFDDSNGAITVT